MSEVIRPDIRGRVVGALQAGWAIGYGIAVLLSTLLFIMVEPEHAWRILFALGFVPALLVLWIRRNLQDSSLSRDQSNPTASPSSNLSNTNRSKPIWEIFSPPYISTTIRAFLLTFGIYGGNYVMITWLPAYLKLVLGLSIAHVGGYLAINILGSFTGAFLNGWMADKIGRRKTFITIACCQVIAVGIYTLTPINLAAALLLGFVLGTLQSGTAAGTGAYLSELFPTQIRGTAQGFCGNAGKAVGALMPTLVGVVSLALPLGMSMGVCAIAGYIVVVCAALILPETKGRDIS